MLTLAKNRLPHVMGRTSRLVSGLTFGAAVVVTSGATPVAGIAGYPSAPASGSPMHPPAAGFTSLSVGYRTVCGVEKTGALACWGSNRWGLAAPLHECCRRPL